jgi:NAD(P)-dependent dehydrogenase (short-subunit alcohol dehydrogenase family)
MPTRGVLVVVGSGAIGLACARRMGVGRHIVLADHAPHRLAAAADELSEAGHIVSPVTVDVANRGSVTALAEAAAVAGELDALVHTAGIAPQQGTSRQIFGVDLYGPALVTDLFFPLARRGTVVTLISSGGAYAEDFPKETERLIATTPTEELLQLQEVDLESPDTRRAYHLAKRALQVRVQVESLRWGKRGARINTVSPGVIATPMTASEFKAFDVPTSDKTRSLIDDSPGGRIGTPDEIAAAVAFLSSAEASFITGTDLLVDGGMTQLRRWRDTTK